LAPTKAEYAFQLAPLDVSPPLTDFFSPLVEALVYTWMPNGMKTTPWQPFDTSTILAFLRVVLSFGMY
jgi:hypothetical protein